jgi:hypothetical protein
MSEKLIENELWEQELWTQKEVANYFRVVQGTVKNWRDQGLLSYWQAPGSTRVLYLSVEVRNFHNKHLKLRGEGDKPKQLKGVKKGKPVVSTKTDKDWRI